jgi:hypothetical protein
MSKQTVKSWRCGNREVILWEDDSVTLISEFDTGFIMEIFPTRVAYIKTTP